MATATKSQKRTRPVGRVAAACAVSAASSVGKAMPAAAARARTIRLRSNRGKPTHCPAATNGATTSGPMARPSPSSVCTATTAVSSFSGKSSGGKLFSGAPLRPKPSPMLAVPSRIAGKASDGSTQRLPARRSCESALAASIASRSVFSPSRRASVPPLTEPTIARATCGRKIAPYCALDSPSVPVRIVPLAGKLTIASPCSSALTYTRPTAGAY